MSVTTIASLPKTPLDYVAQGYWQDFLSGAAIGDRFAYEAQLKNCELDESLSSLQRVDTLLTQIRRDLIKTDRWEEGVLLADEQYRNFMVFLAFYAGRVLAQQWQRTSHWYGQFELNKRYPELSISADDFYQHMAIVYNEESHAKDAALQHNDIGKMSALFFPLEAIGQRLFGHIDRRFQSVQGGQVESGLYQAVSARLANTNPEPTTNPESKPSDANRTPIDQAQSTTENTDENTDENGDSRVNANINTKLDSEVNSAEMIAKPHSLEQISVSDMPHDMPADNDFSNQQRYTKPELSKANIVSSDAHSANASLTSASLTSAKPIQSPTVTPMSSTADLFTQLLNELDEIEVIQTTGKQEYQDACKILNQFEQHIAKQQKPRAEVHFSTEHQIARKHALSLLQQSADTGNTAAMLRLAMYDILGEGLIDNTEASIEAGVDRTKQAASKNDSRAQRLLSKMYYQGVGVAQDINNGKYWLEQAAENGHVEAAELMVKWKQAEALMTTNKQEQNSIQRYQLLIGGIVLLALLLIIFI